MKKRYYLLIAISIIIVISIAIIDTNKKDYKIIWSDDCNIKKYYTTDKVTYYTTCIKDIINDSKKNEQLTDEDLLNSVLINAKSKKEYNDGGTVQYYFKDFSIIKCQKLYQDHVKPSNNVIIGPNSMSYEEHPEYCLPQ